MQRAVLVFASALIAGCAAPEPKEPPLEGLIVLSSSACLGLCPVYTMQVGPDDRYRLKSEANTINPGRSSGGLPVGSFRRALDLLDRYEFDDLERSYTPDNKETCPERVTGTPVLTIQRRTDDLSKLVTYDVGCLKFAKKDDMDQMIEGLYRTFRINDFVAVGEPPKADDQRPPQ